MGSDIIQDFKDIPNRNHIAGKSYFDRIRPCLDKSEKIEYLTTGMLNGEVVVALTNSRILIRPSPSHFKSKKKEAVADISYKEVDSLKKTGIRGNKIEMWVKSPSLNHGVRMVYDSISELDGMTDRISEKAGLEKVKICPDCKDVIKYSDVLCKCGKVLSGGNKKSKSVARKGLGISGAIAGGIGGGLILVVGIIFGGLFIVLGALLTLTIIGAIIGIPVMIVGVLVLIGCGAMGGGGIMAGVKAGKYASKTGQQVEWRRLKEH